MLGNLRNLFNIDRLTPRERRRISVREEFKGVTASAKLTEAQSRKRAQRRCHRRALAVAKATGLRDNPAGSKLAMKFAKAAGYGIEEDDKIRPPTPREALAWMHAREEPMFREGENRGHVRLTLMAQGVRDLSGLWLFPKQRPTHGEEVRVIG